MLCALGLKVLSLKLFEIIAEHIRTGQKVIRHTQLKKLQEVFIATLSTCALLCAKPMGNPPESDNVAVEIFSHIRSPESVAKGVAREPILG